MATRATALGLPQKLNPTTIAGIRTNQYPLPAPRLANSRLHCDKQEPAFGITLPNWLQGVDQVLAQLIERKE
ncbi:sugar nucleotide-binding protein (plasmid) [Chromobacterium amazonense]|uniref:sugar nucleotide-binding protein n=1 Tax=Chromobacterium amazonense TaxID=1382803 RepID=UPI00237D9C21|nr:sugar nucleotide-binding protein [Chromobacterium amazonense]MDE1713180.1 sugar nucleotide-binding protein [Chromobacterium amazonense]